MKIRGLATLAAAGAISICAGLVNASAFAQPPSPEIARQLKLFEAVVAEVEKASLSPINEKRAMEAALAGFMESLDSHSDYITPATWAEMAKPGGSVGLELTSENGIIRIVSVSEGSPAAKAGIKPGDSILGIDGHQSTGMALFAVIELLRGPVGTPIMLTLSRMNTPDLTFALKRERIALERVKFTMVSAYGHLRISAIDESTLPQVKALLSKMMSRSPKPQGLVLDLRDCQGGLLLETVGLTGAFQGRGRVFSDRGKDPKDVQLLESSDTDLLVGQMPIVVLVNGATAAGCEIVAAALQDNGHAKVVGMPTFGEGSIQTVMPLRGGREGALKLTTGLFFRASGKPIQKVGITPDLPVASSKEEADRFVAGLVYSERTAVNAPSPETETPRPKRDLPIQAPPPGYAGDYQLDRALALIAP